MYHTNSGFNANYFESDIELSLPSSISVANLSWVGVCANGSSSTVLASVIISPQLVTNVPCNTTLLGELPAGTNSITGRVYLLNRETFAVIGFSINLTTGLLIISNLLVYISMSLLCVRNHGCGFKLGSCDMLFINSHFFPIIDAVFWLGSGSTPSINGMLAPYSDNM